MEQPSHKEPIQGYFAGGLTGLSKEEIDAFYRPIRDALKKHGIHVYLPVEHSAPNSEQNHDIGTPQEIFELDCFRVSLCDFVYCNLNNPSTGTGMELMLARANLVPVFAFYEKGLQLGIDVSRMPVGADLFVNFGMAGSIEKSPEVLQYEDPTDLVNKLLAQTLAARERMRNARIVKRNLDRIWIKLDLGLQLRDRMECQGWSDEYIAEQVGSSPELIRKLTLPQEEIESQFKKDSVRLFKKAMPELIIDPSEISALRYMNPSTVQLGMLGKVLGMNLFDLLTLNSEDIVESRLNLQHVGRGVEPARIEFLFQEEMLKYQSLNLGSLYQGISNRYSTVTTSEWTDRLEHLNARLDDPNGQLF